MPTNRQWILRARPTGLVKESDFELRESPVPAVDDGQALIRVTCISFDPAMRAWLDDRPSYVPPVGLGDVMRATAVGRVIESRDPRLAVGALVQGMFGWQEYAIAGAKSGAMFPAMPLPEGVTPTLALGTCGITGLTAYFGLFEIGAPKPGQTVVVSGAAGATGSVAAQLARIHGCRVVGIAGGPDKCRWLVETAKLDAAIDYKHDDVRKKLKELCPKGVDVYFDNVGGEILEHVLDRLAMRARVVLCGAISGYNETRPGPRNLSALVVKRARMEGFIVLDYMPRFAEGTAKLIDWVARGEIAHAEDIQHGIENAPRTLLRLFEGKNLGKQLLSLE
jgi:NADPH-dependent curcumin reductase CurA